MLLHACMSGTVSARVAGKRGWRGRCQQTPQLGLQIFQPEVVGYGDDTRVPHLVAVINCKADACAGMVQLTNSPHVLHI